MIIPALADFMEMFDYEGSFLFVERFEHERPVFHIESCAEIKTKNGHFATKENTSVLYASDILYNKPEMMAGMVRSIANDVTVCVVYADSTELARYLVKEAQRVIHSPFTSTEGRIMDHAMRMNQE